MNSHQETRKFSRRKKLTYALILNSGLLLLLEGLFRLLGVFAPIPAFTEFQDPRGLVQVRFNWNHLKPEFPKAKPANGFRIMIAGESTAVGFPYHPRSTFGVRLELMLAEALPDRKIEVIHIGKMSMYSAEIERVVRDAVRYHPDLMIVYSGQNEFISLSRRLPPPVMFILELAGKSRVAQGLGRAAELVIGGSMLAFVQNWEENPETGLSLPPPAPISPKDYERAFREYQENLQRMIADCRESRVHLVFSTMTDNLRDWVPDFRPYPQGWPEPKKKASRELYGQADALIFQHRYQEADDLLAKNETEFAGYAPLSFLRGRTRTGLLPAGPKVLRIIDQGTFILRSQALADFQRAISEEAKTTITHRAPPELNGIIRSLADQPGVWTFDAEAAFNSASPLPPGFDWFEDHCHPNLAGQQLFAEGLFRLLRERGLPLPAEKWKPVVWNEEIFDNLAQLDDDFFHHTYLTMAIWLGLRKRLPDHDDYVRGRLHAGSNLKPEDPLPAVLEALYAMMYGDSIGPGQRLARWFRDRPTELEKCLARYFTNAVELRQGVFLARLNLDPDTPPLRGLLKSGMFSAEKSGQGPAPAVMKPLDYYSAFLDLAAGGVEITPRMKSRLPAGSRETSPRPELVLADPGQGRLPVPGPGAALSKIADGARYQIAGTSAFLGFGPLRINPLDYDSLQISLALEGTAADPEPVLVYWSGIDESGRPLMGVAKLEVPAPGRPGEYVVQLSALPRWVLASEIREFRLYPRIERGTLVLRRMSLKP